MKNIFISSTCFDLIDLRDELRIYLQNYGLTPIMSDQPSSEFSTFSDKNSIETCLVNVRSADVVVLILSQRYGPSLDKQGFGDFSATHLEYLEAKKANKKIIFFVRDRLEADYNNYKKNSKPENLLWIKPTEIKLFSLIDEHKTLKNADNNNWYWTFRSSVDLKERMRIDLKDEIKSTRLNLLIEQNRVPFLSIELKGKTIPNTELIHVSCKINNFGTQTAVEPIILFYIASDYKNRSHKNVFKTQRVSSIIAGNISEEFTVDIEVMHNERGSFNRTYIIEIIYKTVFGDILADLSEFVLSFHNTHQPVFRTYYKEKTYESEDTYSTKEWS